MKDRAGDVRGLRAIRVFAAGGKGDYKLMVREFLAYEKLANRSKDDERRGLLQYVGDFAAAKNDAETALRCYTDLYAFFDPKDEGCKYERGRVERAMNHWKGKVRKTQTSDLSADEDVISLDE